MAEQIQFNCPVCATLLRLPLEMAGVSGPCPCCSREIVAPDPNVGTVTQELPEPIPVTFEPFKPFAESPPLVPAPARHDPPPEPAVVQPEVQKPAVREAVDPVPRETTPAHVCMVAPQVHTRRVVLVLSIMLTSVVSLMAGYFLGIRSNWLVSSTPPLVLNPVAGSLDVKAADPVKAEVRNSADQSLPVNQPGDAKLAEPVTEPDPVRNAEPVKASSAAQAALRAFLEAPDWSTRRAHVLAPDKLRQVMEQYSHEAPDGPTPYKSITVEKSYTDKKTGSTLFIFQVVTEAHPSGIPVAVVETSTGWQVDWKTFVEFRDDHFRKFADEGTVGQSARFHLLVTTPPAERAARTENADFAPFLLDPPFPGCQKIAYVRKISEAYKNLKELTADGKVFTPVLEVARRNTPDGKGYIEITKIVASDWLPEDL